MATPAITIDPTTGERVNAPQIDPNTGERLQQPTGPSSVEPDVSQDAWKAAVHGRMLDTPTSYALQNKDEIDKQMRARSPDYDSMDLEPGIANDFKAGYENSILGLTERNKLPQTVRNPGTIDKFVSGVGQFVGDIPFMLAGGLAGGAAGSEVPIVGNAVGAGAGAFALPAVARQALIEGITKGTVTSFSDIMRRMANVVWAGSKGAAVGAATEAAGGLPVGSFIAKSGVATTAVKGLYQATALTTAADLLEGKLPTKESFAGNAALIVPLNLITHGVSMSLGDSNRALMDVYAKDGKTPQESTQTLHAQPTVKPDLPEGLRPAIQTGEGVVDGDTTESHEDVAERVLGKKPVSMEQLEADPLGAIPSEPLLSPEEIESTDKRFDLVSRKEIEEASGLSGDDLNERFNRYQAEAQALHDEGRQISDPELSRAQQRASLYTTLELRRAYDDAKPKTLADQVLENPVIHEQDVIDRAWQIKKDAIDAGEVETPEGEDKPLAIEDLYDRASLNSGRGFVTPDGEFLSRMEARKWTKDNEPDVHEMWLEDEGGDTQAEFHSEAYGIARMRVQGRNLAEGDPTVDSLPPDVQRFLAEARSETGILNKVKAGLKSVKYGYEAVRTLLVGPRDMFRAEGEQIVSRFRKLVPDKVEQEALHFARDYRGDPEALRSAIEEVRAGDNENLKSHLPAMERALEPLSPEMQQADTEMTQYFQNQLARGRQLGTLDSAVDPSRYSPRFFMRATEEAGTGVGRPRFTDKTVNSIRRDYLHTLDPLTEGNTEARTFNAFDEMSIYNDRMAVANSTALFKTELKNSALGVEGSRDKVPAGWVPLTKQFEDKRTFVQDDGSSVTTVKNLYVPKDIADALKPLLEDPYGSQVSKFLHIQSIVKGIELTLSAFHMKALTVTAFNNMGLRDFLGSIHSDNNAPENEAVERRGALYGLQTTKTGAPFDAYQGLKPTEESTGALATIKDSAVVKGVDAMAKGITKATFDIIQRKWKVMDWAKKEAGWVANNPNATESDYASAMRGYAKEVNAAYGGLNWDVMGVSKGMQNISRMILLAPDWTFSNVANLKYALTDSGTAGASSRAFFLKSFVTGVAATAAASLYFGHKYDPTDVRHMDQVYLGKDKDGKEMYANWFFVGAPKDALSLYKRTYSDGPIAGLAQMVISKASPALGIIIGEAENKEPTGKPIYKAKDSAAKKTLDQGAFIAGRVVPITGESAVETVARALTDPNHDYSYKDLLELAADALGSPTTHAAPKGGSAAKQSSVPPGSKGRTAAKPLGKSKFSIRGGR